MGDVFAKWEERQRLESVRRAQRRVALEGGEAERGKGRAGAETESKGGGMEQDNGKGKGKSGPVGAPAGDTDEDEEQAGTTGRQINDQDLGPLVVLACRHIYHQSCLEAVQVEDTSGEVHHDGREFRCPIDG